MKADSSQNAKADILLVDDTIENLRLLTAMLGELGYSIRPVPSGRLALQAIERLRPDLILLDINMPDMNGFEVCETLRARAETRDIPVIFISALTDTIDKVKAFEVGGLDYVTKPFQAEEVLARIETHLELSRLRTKLETSVRDRTAQLNEALEQVKVLKERVEAENVILRQEVQQANQHAEIIAQSEPMRHVLELAEQVAPTDSTVLVLGETGTGKELVARAIHNLSPRKHNSLIVVNCAAMPGTLVESELFGREKGAFTGALTRQIGRFEVANGSTLFLDEIGEMPTEVQVKLLRVLQEGEFERLGSTSSIRVDVRVVAATNRNLEEEVASGRFRQDLYYRLNVFPIRVPALRERPQDIEALAWSFVNEFNLKMGKRVEQIPPDILEKMKKNNWLGNVRELRNTIERAMILCTGPSLQLDLPADAPPSESPAADFITLAEMEKQHVIKVLQNTNYRIRGAQGAAEQLGLKPTTLESRMRKLGISRPPSASDIT